MFRFHASDGKEIHTQSLLLGYNIIEFGTEFDFCLSDFPPYYGDIHVVMCNNTDVQSLGGRKCNPHRVKVTPATYDFGWSSFDWMFDEGIPDNGIHIFMSKLV